VDLVTIAVELYALMPDEFTAARNAKAKELAAAGEKELAKEVRTLPKPSAAAWLVNMLVARRREETDQVLELGAALREAQEELDPRQLKELGRQRHQVLAAVVKEGRSLAGELGHPVSEAIGSEAEQTLRAAMTDADAAAAVASGRLVRSLTASGLEPVELDGAVAGPLPSVRSARTGRPAKSTRPKVVEEPVTAGKRRTDRAERAEQRKAEDAAHASQQARAELERAERRVAKAEADVEKAQHRLQDVEARREELAEELAELKNRMRDLDKDIAAADREADIAQGVQDEAEAALGKLQAEAYRARKRLDQLG
jgi:flagellin-like hook-associated protein FlgL